MNYQQRSRYVKDVQCMGRLDKYAVWFGMDYSILIKLNLGMGKKNAHLLLSEQKRILQFNNQNLHCYKYKHIIEKCNMITYI